MKPKRPILVLIVLAAAALLGGCAGVDGTNGVGHYVVSAPQTPLYRYGPAQSFGPDMNLQQNQHVVVMRRDSGYSRIMTDDGQTGYVASEDLSPAPPPPKPTPTSSPGRIFSRGGGSSSRISSANRSIQESGPLFDADLPPLPQHNFEDTGNTSHKPETKPEPKAEKTEKTESKEKPQFRYPKPRPGFRVNIPENR